MTARPKVANGHVARWIARQLDAGRIDTPASCAAILEALAIRECPVCGRRAVYSPSCDRYFHLGDSPNIPCWMSLDTLRPTGWQHERRPAPVIPIRPTTERNPR